MNPDDEFPKVLTPRLLAEHWQCSERHVRNMIERQEILHFKLGGKLIRIREQDVLEYEDQQMRRAGD